MATFEINVSTEKQKCAQCGKIGTGYYKAKNKPGKYICPKCVMDNIKRKL